MNTDLNATFPAPKTMFLGGREFHVSELTFDSYAKLQTWIKKIRPHPYDRLRAQRELILKSLGPQEYRALLAEAYTAAEHWPPSPISLEGKRLLFADDDGSAELVRVALAQEGATVTTEEALEIVKSMSADEASQFTSVVFGISPKTAIESEVEAEIDPKA